MKGQGKAVGWQWKDSEGAGKGQEQTVRGCSQHVALRRAKNPEEIKTLRGEQRWTTLSAAPSYRTNSGHRHLAVLGCVRGWLRRLRRRTFASITMWLLVSISPAEMSGHSGSCGDTRRLGPLPLMVVYNCCIDWVGTAGAAATCGR